jgi:hypothetical protein
MHAFIFVLITFIFLFICHIISIKKSKEVEMGEIYDMNGFHQNAFRILFEKPAGKRTLAMFIHR